MKLENWVQGIIGIALLVVIVAGSAVALSLYSQDSAAGSQQTALSEKADNWSSYLVVGIGVVVIIITIVILLNAFGWIGK